MATLPAAEGLEPGDSQEPFQLNPLHDGVLTSSHPVYKALSSTYKVICGFLFIYIGFNVLYNIPTWNKQVQEEGKKSI